MSDLEARLRDTLTERAGAAPDALGLATGARRRLRRRRTTWAVAAAAVVAAVVPFGLSLAPGTDGTGRAADEPTATSGLPPGVIETGYRAESWHDVTFEVPVGWGYGGVYGWCAGGGDDAIVTVATPDRAETRRLVDSVRRFTGPDPNDCPATLGEAEAATITESYATFSICRYGPDDRLEASRRLIGSQASVAEDAIFSSPRRTRMVDCPTEDDLSRTALLSSGGYVATAVTGAVCEGWNGLFASGVERDLTPEALRHLDLSQLPVPTEE